MRRPFRRARPAADPNAVTALLEQLELAGQRNLRLCTALEEQAATVVQAEMRATAFERRIEDLEQELARQADAEAVTS